MRNQYLPRNTLLALFLITIILLLSSIFYTYGKNTDMVVMANVSNVVHFDGFKKISYPDLNPSDIVAGDNIKHHVV